MRLHNHAHKRFGYVMDARAASASSYSWLDRLQQWCSKGYVNLLECHAHKYTALSVMAIDGK